MHTCKCYFSNLLNLHVHVGKFKLTGCLLIEVEVFAVTQKLLGAFEGTVTGKGNTIQKKSKNRHVELFTGNRPINCNQQEVPN